MRYCRRVLQPAHFHDRAARKGGVAKNARYRMTVRLKQFCEPIVRFREDTDAALGRNKQMKWLVWDCVRPHAGKPGGAANGAACEAQGCDPQRAAFYRSTSHGKPVQREGYELGYGSHVYCCHRWRRLSKRAAHGQSSGKMDRT